MMEKIIELHTHDGSKNYLELMKKTDGSESKTYLLKAEIPYTKEGRTNKGVKFIDPSGGPLLTEGSTVNGYKIKYIDYVKGYGHVITFE